MAVRPVPEGHHTGTPYIVAQDAAKLIDFIRQAFGAEEIERMAVKPLADQLRRRAQAAMKERG